MVNVDSLKVHDFVDTSNPAWLELVVTWLFPKTTLSGKY